MSKSMVARHYLVDGRVQGVGFRRFVQKQAHGLGLVGKVRNLDDGRVEILARGSENNMNDFERLIARGPALASVSKLSANRVESASALFDGETGFAILEDGETPWFSVG
jgi:acylphosphatase